MVELDTNLQKNTKHLLDKAKKKETKGDMLASLSKKLLGGKVTNKEVLRDSGQATIEINEPGPQKDRSRFFNKAFEEERRQLFFR